MSAMSDINASFLGQEFFFSDGYFVDYSIGTLPWGRDFFFRELM